MAIGTIDDLINAAEGRKAKLAAPVGNLVRPALESAAYDQALSRYQGRDFTPVVSPLDNRPTSMYGSIMGGLGMNAAPDYGQGLSKKGKYGGFYTASDLESAIGGRAADTRSMLASSLRGLAEDRYKQVTGMYKQAGTFAGVPLPGGATGAYAQMATRTGSPGFVSQGFRLSPQQSQASLALNPEYAKAFGSKYVSPMARAEDMKPTVDPSMAAYQRSLAKWFEQNLGPAEETFTTAQQVEATPLSELARSIAVQQYGMNPALARSKFADLDTREYERQRDIEYMQTMGMPFKQYEDIQDYQTKLAEEEYKGQERAAKATTGALETFIQQSTGFNPSALRNATGRPNEWIAERMRSQGKVVQNDGTEKYAPATEILKQGLMYLRSGDVDSASGLVTKVAEEDADLAELINAILSQYTQYKDKQNTNLAIAPIVFENQLP